MLPRTRRSKTFLGRRWSVLGLSSKKCSLSCHSCICGGRRWVNNRQTRRCGSPNGVRLLNSYSNVHLMYCFRRTQWVIHGVASEGQPNILPLGADCPGQRGCEGAHLVLRVILRWFCGHRASLLFTRAVRLRWKLMASSPDPSTTPTRLSRMP